jgi:DNA (cytosine-5)-methyltransferase 1
MIKGLDLCCCAGGASVGYSRAGFDMTGVDIEPQPHYPFKLIQGDALDYLEKHGHEYDFIHASPPCQGYSHATPPEHKGKHPLLIAPFRELLKRVGKPYVIENVSGARKHLINPIMLCGSMFGLNLWRHRYFETSFPLWFAPATCDHSFEPVLLTGMTRRIVNGVVTRREYLAHEKREASGLHWMTIKEMDEAIPPDFTEWIGCEFKKQVFVCKS